METSDIIIRAWDQNRNSKDIIFRSAIQVVGMQISEEEFESSILALPDYSSDTGQIIPEGLFAKWAGYSDDVSLDSELLSFLGIEGNNIPQWFKKEIPKWYQEGSISQKEFVDALKFFEQSGLLT